MKGSLPCHEHDGMMKAELPLARKDEGGPQSNSLLRNMKSAVKYRELVESVRSIWSVERNLQECVSREVFCLRRYLVSLFSRPLYIHTNKTFQSLLEYFNSTIFSV